MEIQKRCKYCGRSFIAHKMTTIYCSPSCNNKDYKRAIREKQIAEYYESHPEGKEQIAKDALQDKAFLTPREAAKVLGIGKSSVYRELASGLIKAVQMKGKTLIRRKDIERLFDNPPEYQSHSEKKQEKREYYTFRQIMEKFKCSKKAIMTRVEKYNIPKVRQCVGSTAGSQKKPAAFFPQLKQSLSNQGGRFSAAELQKSPVNIKKCHLWVIHHIFVP